MKKIVINVCFGGFSLSEKAYALYAKMKYPDHDYERRVNFEKHRWDELPPLKDHPKDERDAIAKIYKEHTIRPDYELDRDDPLLVRVVETLGSQADGFLAKLRVVKIPDDIEWDIHEYDGTEHVEEVHQTWR